MKVVKSVKENGRVYTCTPIEVLTSNYPVMVEGTMVPCLVAVLPVDDEGGRTPLQLDPENPRIAHLVKGRPPNQKTIEELMWNPQSGFDLPALKKALELNGGQQEPAYVFQNRTIDFNRRLCVFRKLCSEGNRAFASVLSVVFPDDTPLPHIRLFLANKHINKPLPWESYNRSREAYRLRVEDNRTDSWIATYFGWKESEATQYIRAYEFVAAHKQCFKDFDVGDWSKYHHAAKSVTLLRLFGVLPPKGDEDGTPELLFDEFQGKNGVNGNLQWFCHLVDSGRLRDCRHVEEVVIPLVREGNMSLLERMTSGFKENGNKFDSAEAKRIRSLKIRSRGIGYQATRLKERLQKMKGKDKRLLSGKNLEAMSTRNELDALRLVIMQLLDDLRPSGGGDSDKEAA